MFELIEIQTAVPHYVMLLQYGFDILISQLFTRLGKSLL